MAVERRHGILLVVMVVVVVVVGIGSQEVEGLLDCMKGCPSRCQKKFHESLFVCSIYCGMRCTCTGGAGNCSVLGNCYLIYIPPSSTHYFLNLFPTNKYKYLVKRHK